MLHTFGSQKGDGLVPFAGLVAMSGELYGTTSKGGAYYSAGPGTIFEISTSGKGYRVLYSFKGFPGDGAFPQGLIHVNGKLYGTTSQGGTGGGTGHCSLYNPKKMNGCGTVFSYNLASGVETILYRFKGGKDGANPWAGLLSFGGDLYGTTLDGGAGKCKLPYGLEGCGTVFKVSP